MDIIMGASRVCFYWFLASHNKILWNTIDLTKLKHKGKNVLDYKYRVDKEALSYSNLSIKMSRFFFNFCRVRHTKLKNVIVEITKLSRTAPCNVFFSFNSYLQKEDLMFVAKRMPNIEKLALPVSWSLYKELNSFRFAFSQWKNLKTLIMANDFTWGSFEIRVLGESCSNLNNLKLVGFYILGNDAAEGIVHYLQSLSRLSLRCSLIDVEVVLLLIRGLRNLAILNLTQYKILRWYFMMNDVVQAATQNLDKLITCSEYDCQVCKDRSRMFREQKFYEKHWQNDEIKELDF
ncbi:PREDICTED: putative F-box protein At4g11580 [Camelina sativa]|uniref:F-box protein At4g11580 n=1 Tax=Camelina sativa TaxID=90675 RepID=A0ABM0T7N8_CAMSA|nr:PREDICTED: putative F-box protein At4g11580 [Camelina sativa]